MKKNLTIPGEPRLAQRIREAAGRDALSHANILSGRGDLAAAARFLAAAMECTDASRPCGVCGPCQKVLRGIHPDVVTVEDPDHKNIAVDVLRDAAADAYILPNEGRRKVYIFPDCGLLDPKAQNVLLKVLEEGPPHAAFLFCASSSALLLPTIRSRAVEWRLTESGGEEAEQGGGAKLCQLLCGGDRAAIAAFCADLENGKTDRDALQALLSEARDHLAAALRACYTGEGDPQRIAGVLGRRRISAAADVLEEFIRRCNYNVGVGHLTGALAAALMELS